MLCQLCSCLVSHTPWAVQGIASYLISPKQAQDMTAQAVTLSLTESSHHPLALSDLNCRTAEAREARQLEAGKDLGDSAHATPAGVDAGRWPLFQCIS